MRVRDSLLGYPIGAAAEASFPISGTAWRGGLELAVGSIEWDVILEQSLHLVPWLCLAGARPQHRPPTISQVSISPCVEKDPQTQHGSPYNLQSASHLAARGEAHSLCSQTAPHEATGCSLLSVGAAYPCPGIET